MDYTFAILKKGILMKLPKLKFSILLLFLGFICYSESYAQEYDEMYFNKSDRKEIIILEQIRAEDIIKQQEVRKEENRLRKLAEENRVDYDTHEEILAWYKSHLDSLEQINSNPSQNQLYSRPDYYNRYNRQNPQWSGTMGWNYGYSPNFGSMYGTSFSLSYGNGWNDPFFNGFGDPWFNMNNGVFYDPFDPFYSDFYYNNFGYRHYSPWAWNNRFWRNRGFYGNSVWGSPFYNGNAFYGSPFQRPGVIIVRPNLGEKRQQRVEGVRPSRARSSKSGNTNTNRSRSRSQNVNTDTRNRSRSRVRSNVNTNTQNTQRSRSRVNSSGSQNNNSWNNDSKSNSRSRSRNSYNNSNRSKSSSGSRSRSSTSGGSRRRQ